MKWQLVILVVSVVVGYSLYDDFDPEELKGKNVVITGASDGIGEQLAYTYARLGARVLITARTESKLKKVVERCRTEGSETGVYLYHVADMSHPNAGAELIEFAVDKLGGVDVLVLNHIINNKLGPWMSTAENFTVLETTMRVNFFAYVRVASAAMSSLRESRGSIVVVSSVAGKVPQPYLASYTTSKFALEGFFGALRQEFDVENVGVSVTVCTIALTATETAISSLKEFTGDRIIGSVRVSSPMDVAQAIMRGATKRQDYVYYPYTYGRLAVVAHTLFPNLIEHFQSAAYKQ